MLKGYSLRSHRFSEAVLGPFPGSRALILVNMANTKSERRHILKESHSTLLNAALLFFFVGAVSGLATTYDPTASFEAGFTSRSNPNGVWSYGYSSGFTAPVTLYNQTSQPGVHGPNAQYWSSSPSITATPSVQFNNGAAYNDGNVNIPANGLTLVWFGAQYSDLVFTAPAAGTYALTGVFLGSQNNIGSVVGVAASGSVVFSSSVTSENQTAPFNATVMLAAGGTVVFSAGPGGGNQNTGLSLLVTGPLTAPAATYDPAASFEAGFTARSNPNGVWTYGYSSGFTAAVTPYNQTSQPGVHGSNAQYWSSSPSITATPSVQFNNGPAYNDGNVGIPANGLTLVWFGAQYSDVVFTAPAAGTYYIAGSFLGSQNNVGSAVGVVANGSLIFNSSVNGEGRTAPFSAMVSFAAGNTIVFSAGPGGGNQNTGLSAVVLGPLGSPGTTPAITSVVNDAGFSASAGISTGSWVAVFGTGLAPAGDARIWNTATEIVNGKFPTSLDGTTVTVNGKPAAVEFISPSQVNIQPPDDPAVGPVQVVVTTAGGASNSFTVNYAAVAPGLFAATPPYLAAQHADSSYVSTASPAKPGEVIILWGTGFGAANPPVPAGQVVSGASPLVNNVTVTIGGQPATVDFAGVVGAGLVQMNVHVPTSISNGDAAVVAMAGGVMTQTTANMISVHN